MTTQNDEKTRQRLLEAAGETFAEQGFRNATVREICRRAGANVAAVNYHFGDKEQLYVEVLRYAHVCAVEKYPVDAGLAADASAEERVEAFVRSFLNRVLDSGRPAWHASLMSRELAEPTRALDVLVSEHVRPHFTYVSGAVRELLGAAAPDAVVRACVGSVVGQCLFYLFGRPVFERLNPGLNLGHGQVEALTAHVTAFSLAGIRAARGRLNDGKPTAGSARGRGTAAPAAGAGRKAKGRR